MPTNEYNGRGRGASVISWIFSRMMSGNFRCATIGLHGAILKHDYSIRMGKQSRVVGYPKHGSVVVVGNILEQVNDDLAVLLIQRGCRLVGKNKARRLDQGTGNRDALLFPSREFGWTQMRPPPQSDFGQCLPGTPK